jgi:hypothetical protein
LGRDAAGSEGPDAAGIRLVSDGEDCLDVTLTDEATFVAERHPAGEEQDLRGADG